MKPLLEAVHREVERRAADPHALREALIGVFEFLCSEEGRTDPNCQMVESFIFWLWDANPDIVGAPSDPLPSDHVDLMSNVQCLGYTFSEPHLARNFRATPEDLLQEARALKA